MSAPSLLNFWLKQIFINSDTYFYIPQNYLLKIQNQQNLTIIKGKTPPAKIEFYYIVIRVNTNSLWIAFIYNFIKLKLRFFVILCSFKGPLKRFDWGRVDDFCWQFVPRFHLFNQNMAFCCNYPKIVSTLLHQTLSFCRISTT